MIFITEKSKLKTLKLKIKALHHKNQIFKKETEKIMQTAIEQAKSIRDQSIMEEQESQEMSKLIEGKIIAKKELTERKEKRNDETKMLLKNIENEIRSYQDKIKTLQHEYLNTLAHKLNLEKNAVINEIKNTFDRLFEELKTINLAKIKTDFEENADKEAKNIITWTMQRYAMGSSVDKKEMSIKIPNEKIKGAIIGKEGHNIQYFEEKLDVDVLFNQDGPDIIRVSSHDLLKKTLAKETLELLISKKTINPEAIDECYLQAKSKIDKIIDSMGKKAVDILRIKDVPEKISNLFGRFEYRSSYGQNIWLHSMEVCIFSSLLADEIGANYEIAKLAGFIHDLGKAVDLQIVTDKGYDKGMAVTLLDEAIAEKLNGNQGHDDISKIIMETWQFPQDEVLREKTIYAAYCHHEKVPYKNPEDYIVKSADAISAGRPGARQETFEFYLTRIKELEELGKNVNNVKKAFSVFAGRELRLIVDESTINDNDMQNIAESTAQNIQETLNYPGKIKVNVIRITEYKAKIGVNS